ncbi:MAG: hypothetical protein ABIT35_09990 [Chitinophagaceae bacterium]
MKQFIALCWWMLIFMAPTSAQNDMQVYISTDKGILTLSKNAAGKDVIIISMDCWDEMVAGTKYTSRNLAFAHKLDVCLEIANKKKGFCKNGIGFGCSIYDCPEYKSLIRRNVNHYQRICSVTLWKLKGVVKLVFNDRVDWQSLARIR